VLTWHINGSFFLTHANKHLRIKSIIFSVAGKKKEKKVIIVIRTLMVKLTSYVKFARVIISVFLKGFGP
jgi:hypothetical protein